MVLESGLPEKERLRSGLHMQNMKQNLSGTALEEEDFKTRRVFYTTDIPKLQYSWDAGVAIGNYLKGLKQGKLLGTYCKKCKRTVIPPRVFCELCFKNMDKWVDLKDTGIVNTFSICYVTWDMKKLTYPQIPAVIEIDGATKGKGILHLLAEVEPEKVKLGMKVKAVWKPKSERVGSILDIKHFKPL